MQYKVFFQINGDFKIPTSGISLGDCKSWRENCKICFRNSHYYFYSYFASQTIEFKEEIPFPFFHLPQRVFEDEAHLICGFQYLGCPLKGTSCQNWRESREGVKGSNTKSWNTKDSLSSRGLIFFWFSMQRARKNNPFFTMVQFNSYWAKRQDCFAVLVKILVNSCSFGKNRSYIINNILGQSGEKYRHNSSFFSFLFCTEWIFYLISCFQKVLQKKVWYTNILRI